jgi:uroporphyrinogen-III synthase
VVSSEAGRAEPTAGDLAGARVALLEARQGSELAGLIRRRGGVPVWVPALREVKATPGPELSAFLDALSRGECPVVVFQTGVGVNLLMQEAEQLGRLDELVATLRRVTTVARGPKPGAALSQRGLRASVGTRSPYTTADLLEAMAGLELRDTCVALVNYGERNELLCAELRRRGARPRELQLYEWAMPESVEPLRQLVRDLLDGAVDAVAFTSQIQARHLFRIAEQMGSSVSVAEALNGRVATASVGPTCTAVLRDLGVAPHVEPERPKMGPLVAALADHLWERRASLPP